MKLFFIRSWVRMITASSKVRLVLLIVFLLTSMGLTACGKKGPPMPPPGT